MDAQAQKQIIERITQANNILVTVSNNPSVDQLAACIGLTLLLNRLDKHATAVFSGQVPSTLEFLQPEQTLEKNTDSLRDFIISLDKNKADKLRYKVEDQFVRIFITPYKTSLSQKDLVFSEGDFNVEVVLALGVHLQTELDAAITAHGRILHDATVISMVAGKSPAPSLGQINAEDPAASSLCEMLVNLSDGFGQNLIDNQMATAFLTGIVAETKRFSNEKTSPRSMSASAKLMAAGANQQLIVSKLEPPEEPPPPPAPAPPPPPPPPKKPPTPPKPTTGLLNVAHHPSAKDSAEVEIPQSEIRIDEEGNILPKDFVPETQIQPQISAYAPVQAVPSPQQTMVAPTAPVPTVEAAPHSLLSTDRQSLAASFTADTGEGQGMNSNGDPAQAAHSEGILERSQPDGTVAYHGEKTIQPVAGQSLDSILANINDIHEQEPFDPAGHPLMALGAQPVADELNGPPPPIPPPLMQAPASQPDQPEPANRQV